MPKCKLVALTTPLPGKEAEFHDWYQNTHLPEMTSIPGLSGRAALPARRQDDGRRSQPVSRDL